MARKKKQEVVENPETETVVDTVEVEELPTEELVEETVVKGTVANVVNGSHTARTYTKERHGDNFAELAKEYAAHAGGTVVVR